MAFGPIVRDFSAGRQQACRRSLRYRISSPLVSRVPINRIGFDGPLLLAWIKIDYLAITGAIGDHGPHWLVAEDCRLMRRA